MPGVSAPARKAAILVFGSFLIILVYNGLPIQFTCSYKPKTTAFLTDSDAILLKDLLRHPNLQVHKPWLPDLTQFRKKTR